MSFMTEAPWKSTPKSHNTSAKLRKMPSSTLPNNGELSHEDDWTRVKDPKEKKRIQNRVAQRTYRHRMKARLGELQARLDSHEKRGSSSSTGTNSSTPTAMTPESDSIPPPDCTIPTTFTATSAPLPPSSRSMEESPSPMALGNEKPRGQFPLMQPSIYDQPVDDSDPSLFPQTAHMMHSPPHSQPSPQIQPHGLLSPPGQPASESGGPKMSQDFMMDCLRFQTQLLNRLNNLEQEPVYPQGPYGTTDNVSTMLDGITQAEQANALAAFTPANTNGMDFGFDTGCEPWKPDPFVKMQCQGVSPTEKLNFSPIPASGPMGPVVMASPPDMKPLTSMPPPMVDNTSQEDRFVGIMASVSNAGFESFDRMVAAYYSDNFGDASPLANERRVSRNRQLPKVIFDISNAAMQWSSWEQRVYYEEIRKSAESMVISERATARANVMSKIGPLIEVQNGANPGNTVDSSWR